MTYDYAIIGRKGSGKSTLVEYMVNEMPMYEEHQVIKFADPLKNMTRALFETMGFKPETIEEMVEGDKKETPIPGYDDITPRKIMQTLGTEWGRNQISEDFWGDIWEERYSRNTVFCDDVRFDNELSRADDFGMYIIRVVAFDEDSSDSHASEQIPTSEPVEIFIVNDKVPFEFSLEELESAIDSADLERETIIVYGSNIITVDFKVDNDVSYTELEDKVAEFLREKEREESMENRSELEAALNHADDMYRQNKEG